MAIALDAFDALKRIGDHADLFRPIRADADKTARTLFAKMMKAKTTGIDDLRAVSAALGAETFGHLFDGLKDTEIKSALTRLDKHAPQAKAAAAERSRHLMALATGDADPARKPVKTRPVRTARSKAAKAVSKRGDDGDPPRLRSEVVDLFRSGGKK